MTTRDEAREKCFEAMEDAADMVLPLLYDQTGDSISAVDLHNAFVAAFDSLCNVPVTVNLIEPTDEMHRAANHKRDTDKAKGLPTPWGSVFKAMATTGNLINAPEKKP